ncbi:MAG: hypothetical protein L3K23_00525 [Thermoplasmata archaeon]|nr:hypothetical protein [Thermoplasmata archaeon]
MLNRCRSRDLKLAWHLQRVAPDLVPKEEPPEGFEDLLQSTDPTLRFQLRDLASRGKLPAAQPLAAGPLFSGTLRVVALSYPSAPGTPSVGAVDAATCVQYAQKAAPAIVRYATQYGACSAAVDPVTGVFAPPGSPRRFNDSAVKAWVNAYLAGASLPPATTAVILLNPPGVVNTDADPSQGVLGYHGLANGPYSFVNVVGSGFTLADPSDQFALALGHEIAEMIVDPKADLSNPEVCDPCGPNCQTVFRDYFDEVGAYRGTDTAFPPPYAYAYFLNAIVQPPSSTACPAPASSCAYAPPTPTGRRA